MRRCDAVFNRTDCSVLIKIIGTNSLTSGAFRASAHFIPFKEYSSIFAHFKKQLAFAAVVISAATLVSCGGNGQKSSKVKSARAGINEVIIHINSNPDKLNPITMTNAYSQQVSNDLFMGLLSLDNDSIGAIIPSLAVARPTVTEVTEGEFKGGLKIDYEIITLY